jgi:hypothetical protein
MLSLALGSPLRLRSGQASSGRCLGRLGNRGTAFLLSSFVFALAERKTKKIESASTLLPQAKNQEGDIASFMYFACGTS